MLSDQIFAVAEVLDKVVLWVLILLSVASIAFILERFLYLKKISSESRVSRARVKMALQSHSVNDVEEMSRNLETLEGRALNYALRHVKDSGGKGLEELFNTFSLIERPELEKRLNFLATVGSNAPYIGLLGTVLGIMRAFHDLALDKEAGQQTVMAGISLALVATAAGLFVAIPAVISYNYFQRQVKGIMQSLDAVKELCLVYAKKKGL